MQEKESITAEEQRIKHEKTKEKLMRSYRQLNEALDYAMDNVEEGLIREKREALAQRIRTLSAEIERLGTEERTA